MIVEMNKRLNRMDYNNFDGGSKFVISTPGSTITSPTLTFINSKFTLNIFTFISLINFIFSSIIVTVTNSISNFTSYFNPFINIKFIINFNSIYIFIFIVNYTFVYNYISIITLTGAFNFIYNPRGVIITNHSCISIFIITIIPILTIN